MRKEIPVSERAVSLRSWYQRPLGQLLAKAELSALSGQLSNVFGYHLMVIDPPWGHCSLEDSRIPHQVIQSVSPGDGAVNGLAGHTDAWPIATDSLDAIVLPHTLELSRDPHQVLRETDRCMIPDGHLVIMGFNPRSIWGMRRALTPRRRSMPWDSRFLAVSRIKDWLALLGFDTLHSHYLFHRPPVQNQRMLEKLQILEPASGHGQMLLSAGYILLAQKRSAVLTPLKAGVTRRRLFPVGIPGPTQGNVRRSG